MSNREKYKELLDFQLLIDNFDKSMLQQRAIIEEDAANLDIKKGIHIAQEDWGKFMKILKEFQNKKRKNDLLSLTQKRDKLLEELEINKEKFLS